MQNDGPGERIDEAPPIGDYAFLADCHSTALVSREGSIDWCCMPRLDSPSIFGRLIGWREGGFCRLAPVDDFTTERAYLEDSLILETRFRTAGGVARLIDFMPMREGGREEPYLEVLRIVIGERGAVEMRVDVAPVFDYGAAAPWIQQCGEGCHQAIGGADGLLIGSDLPLDGTGRGELSGTFTVEAGDRRHLALVYAKPEDLDDGRVTAPDADEIEQRLEGSLQWWRRWIESFRDGGHDPDRSRRSALVLKGLTHSPSGAIAAAATTSLPEAPARSRNWDYRFTWVRDSVFTARALLELGFVKEADGFRRFVERAAAGRAEEVQVVYGIDGRHRLPEFEVPELSGYRGALPVRVGNAAARQLQLDVFGELLDLSYRWHELGNSPDEAYWEFIVSLVEKTIEVWRRPDRGLWEMRGEPRHFVHSKVLCWRALDAGLRLAEDRGSDLDLERWRRERDTIRREIEDRGYDEQRGIFTQSFDSGELDASLLLLPVFGFVDHADERMRRTAEAVWDELSEDGLLRRYLPDGDGLEGREGVFIACTFWLAECLARQGRRDDAEKVYERAAATANDLGLFSEEYDVAGGEMLGNFPQGLTHLSQIAAAVAIGDESRRGSR